MDAEANESERLGLDYPRILGYNSLSEFTACTSVFIMCSAVLNTTWQELGGQAFSGFKRESA